nr:cytochrome P450 [Streptomyces sp. DSM 15324]
MNRTRHIPLVTRLRLEEHRAYQQSVRFDIDRWLPENRAQHHPYAYRPFGTGERACIGRQFALTEARLALALILRRFAVSAPSDYRLHVDEALTYKPSGFTLWLRTRQPRNRRPAAVQSPEPAAVPPAAAGARRGRRPATAHAAVDAGRARMPRPGRGCIQGESPKAATG